jgi:lysophospholipase
LPLLTDTNVTPKSLAFNSKPAVKDSAHPLFSKTIEAQPKIIPHTHPQLSYYSAVPASPIARLAILHGYGDHAGRHIHVIQWMAEHNIASFAVDFRGHGRSAGKPGSIRRWDDHLTDLAAFLAIDELSTKHNTPLFILGHSHGALIAAAAAMRGQLNHARGIILVAPYLQLKMPVPFRKRILGAVGSHLFPSAPIKSGLNAPMLTRDPEMASAQKTDPYCRGIATPRWFTETIKVQQQTRSSAEQFKLPLLMLLPGDDAVADVRASVSFFDSCASTDKTILHYPENRHELLRELDRERAFADIFGWISQRTNR